MRGPSSTETNAGILYAPRAFNTIGPWERVGRKEWMNPRWQRANVITDTAQLRRVISLSDSQAAAIDRTLASLRAMGRDPMRITPYYASLMQPDPFHPEMLPGERAEKRLDPIFWQSVPTPANLLFPDTGLEGAMAETCRSFGAAYQRYPNRVALFVAANSSCASYCIHCQRAKSLNASAHVGAGDIARGLFYIGWNSNIDEVLVTGGDALMISADRLQFILEELSRIPHLRVIRIATRVPVVMPMGVTDRILERIASSANRHSGGNPKYVYVMTHINHHQEITAELAEAVSRCHAHGFSVCNQTVLLNHVNDYYRTLAETFRRMFWIGVHPYYLLQCHKEKGLVHFITPVQVGKIYMQHMQGWLSGMCTPRYAMNLEGGGGKILLMPSGHDTLNILDDIEQRISESYAMVRTWDGKQLQRYEALGRSTQSEYLHAVEIMDEFIGRKGVFLPKIIIVDQHGRHLYTTNRMKLPSFEKSKKSRLLGYRVHERDMPLTNPADIQPELERAFLSSPLAAITPTRA
jgi:lysine 2,3-aminomutase